MKINELSLPSKLYKHCNGSGKIINTTVCESCYGYGISDEILKEMDIKKIFERMSMSDYDYIFKKLRAMPSVKCRLDTDNFLIKLEFILDNEPGSIWFRPRRDGTDLGEKYFRKISAAARSMMGGQKPANIAVAKEILRNSKNGIRNNAIKILTNPDEWEVVGLRWAGCAFGQGLN